MKNKITQITMLVQVVLVLFVIIFGIIGMFNYELFSICKILVGLLMFVMAYNNQKIYNRKYMTAIYVALGIIILAAALFA